jgi:hypothetical protein
LGFEAIQCYATTAECRTNCKGKIAPTAFQTNIGPVHVCTFADSRSRIDARLQWPVASQVASSGSACNYTVLGC